MNIIKRFTCDVDALLLMQSDMKYEAVSETKEKEKAKERRVVIVVS